MLESDPSNNEISESVKTPIKRKVRFNMNQSSNKSKRFCINLDNVSRQKSCEAAKKRMRTISENCNDMAKEILRSEKKANSS